MVSPARALTTSAVYWSVVEDYLHSHPELSLEELMALDAGRVYGASERLQPVTEAPASVSFITAEEIARYGYRTLADVLRVGSRAARGGGLALRLFLRPRALHRRRGARSPTR